MNVMNELNNMADWYRRETWTKTDEDEFFTKLGRARKDGRMQYLHIQFVHTESFLSKYQINLLLLHL